MSVWTGRVDTADGPRALRWHQMVKPLTDGAPPGTALIGFACDDGVRRNGGRVGAKDGPRAIRQALTNLAWHPWCAVYEAGNVSCSDGELEQAQAELAYRVASVLRGGHRVLVLGGGHETAWGSFRGTVHAAEPHIRVGVINVDAHFDLRADWPPTSGTSFKHVADWCRENDRPFRYLALGISETSNTAALFDRARELGADWRFDTDFAPWKLDEPLTAVNAFADTVDLIHLSIDLDVLPAAVMPAVSAPAARGVPLESVEAIVSAVLRRADQVAVVDIVELNPAFDIDGRGAKVAARLAWRVAREFGRPEGKP